MKNKKTETTLTNMCIDEKCILTGGKYYVKRNQRI